MLDLDHAGPSWKCERCGLIAVDLANARDYSDCFSTIGRPGRVVDRLLRDCENGRPVDPLMLARATGACWADLGEYRLLCEVAWMITSNIEPASPWSVAPPTVVANMITAAMHAAYVDLVDVLDVIEVDDARCAGIEVPDLPNLDHEARAQLATQVGAEIVGPEYAAAIGRLYAFGYPHGTRDDAAESVLTAIVAQLRDDAHRLGQFDGGHADAIRTALAAAGFTLTHRGLK